MIKLNQILLADCMDVMREIPDKSVDLVLADIPYNIGKGDWDKYGNNEYIEYIGQRFLECERVLKGNGSFFWFHSDFPQMVRLQSWIEANTDFVFKNLITINKQEGNYIEKRYPSNSFRGYINWSEYLCFYTFFDNDGKNTDVLFYFDMLLRSTGLTKSKIKEAIPLADHCFRVSNNNFALPSDETYEDIKSLIVGEFAVRPLTDFKNTFNKSFGMETTWKYRFNKEKGRFHNTQKPVELIKRIILQHSNQGDIILDPFSGSGTTAVACLMTNRNYICIEKDEDYYREAVKRVNNHKAQEKLFA